MRSGRISILSKIRGHEKRLLRVRRFFERLPKMHIYRFTCGDSQLVRCRCRIIEYVILNCEVNWVGLPRIIPVRVSWDGIPVLIDATDCPTPSTRMITVPEASSPRRPARPAIWVYSPMTDGCTYTKKRSEWKCATIIRRIAAGSGTYRFRTNYDFEQK